MNAEHPGPWIPICQSCWEKVNPDDYFPDAMYYKVCSICGDSCLTGHTRQRNIDEWERCTGLNDSCILTSEHSGLCARPN
jgi:hypothetical protein